MVRYWLRRLLFGQPVVQCVKCGCWVNPSNHPLPACARWVWQAFCQADSANRAQFGAIGAKVDKHQEALEIVDAYLTQDDKRLDAIEEFITRPEPLLDYEKLRDRVAWCEDSLAHDLSMLTQHDTALYRIKTEEVPHLKAVTERLTKVEVTLWPASVEPLEADGQ